MKGRRWNTVKWLAVIVVVVLMAGAAVWWSRAGGVDVSVGFDRRIELTSQEVRRIERIGQWEFLSMPSEVVADTLRKGFFSDDRLVVIYSGVPRIGIDMARVEDGWAAVRGDTVSLRLPAVHLLDKDFIDEARMRVFYESGKWSNQDRMSLYGQAYRKMLRQALTPSNLRRAEANARGQFTALFRALGFQKVEVTFVS